MEQRAPPAPGEAEAPAPGAGVSVHVEVSVVEARRAGAVRCLRASARLGAYSLGV